MNSNHQEEEAGPRNIYRPSGRPGIHGYQGTEMGQYGLKRSQNKTKRGNSPANDNQGYDEVDNVQSKLCRQMSPLPVKKNKLQRSNSYALNDENTSDDNSNVLSKSLPTTLPSRLYYSDDSEQEEFNQSAASASNQDFLATHGRELNISDHRSSNRKFSFSSSVQSPGQQKSSNSKLYVIIAVVIGIIAVKFCDFPTIFQYLPKTYSDQATQTNSYVEALFENNMNSLQKKYNLDQNSILKLKSGISTIFTRMDVGSFIFVYNSDTNNFNPSEFDKFINEVAYTAARYLRNGISSIKHTVLSTDLDMREHSELINRYRDEVDKTGVLLVKELDSVPSDLAMAFHYYCDEYAPLVKRSAIFFTLNLANCSNAGEKKSTHGFIEKCLAGKWKTVSQENMGPLLTRIVNVIIDVTSVF